MKRLYIARWDDGHDNGQFLFESDSRKGSHKNYLDARMSILRFFGKYAYRNQEVKDIRLISEEDALATGLKMP